MTARTKVLKRPSFPKVAILAAALLIAEITGSVYVVQSHASTLKCAVNKVNYSVGSSGTCVVYIQKLANYQISTPLNPDGQFGPLTRSAVLTVQRNATPKIAVDGVVGPHTWYALCNPNYGYVTRSITTTTFASLADAAGCKLNTAGGPAYN